jgi:hypothetical protein
MTGRQREKHAGSEADAYLSLSELLLAIVAAGGDDRREAGRRVGRLIATEARGGISSAPCDSLSELEAFLHSRGFMPSKIESASETGFVLGRCPYEEAALANPSLICGLHRAMAEGILEELGGGFEVARLVARHPTTAGCRLELRPADQSG